MMKTVIVKELPICNICKKKEAIFDIPTIMGQWAHLCNNCSMRHSTPALMTLGTKMEVKLCL